MITIGIDLTNAVARFSGQSEARWHPSVILPMTSGEPLITGADVQQHRRGSGYSWPPECQVPYGDQVAFGKGRIAFGEVWRHLSSFKMQDEAWDNYQPYQEQVTWRPDPKPEASSVSFSAEDLIAQTVKGVCPEAMNADNVCLVVPDDMGEGAQQALLDACSEIQNLYLLPRPISIACDWCSQQDASPYALIPENQAVGFIWVLAMAIDRWELCPIEIRRLGSRLIPVRDHTVYSSGIAVDGLGILAAYAVARGKSSWTSVWNDLLLGRLTEELTQNSASSFSCSSTGINLAGLQIHAWPGRLDRSGEQSLCSLDEIQRKLIRRSRVIKPKNHRCLGAVADGSLASLSVDNMQLGNWMMSEFCEEPQVTNGAATIDGAECIAAQMAKNIVPYYDRIAPVKIFYKTTDQFNDPIIATKPLIEGRDVPAGDVAKTPTPITGLSISSGKDSLDLILTRTFGSKTEIRKVSAELREKTSSNEPVQITAEVRAGQGFAKAHVASVTPSLFDSMLNWRTMEPCDKPDDLTYAWPPGVILYKSSGCDISDELRNALRSLEDSKSNQNNEKIFFYEVNCLADSLVSLKHIGGDVYKSVLAGNNTYENYSNTAELRKFSKLLGETIGAYPDNYELFRLSGWMYEACPPEAIKTVKLRLQLGQLNKSDPEVIGKSFSDSKDIKVFIRFVASQFQSGVWNYHWVRALRDLTRLRIETLSVDVISDRQMDIIEKGVLDILENYKLDLRSRYYGAALLLAPHLLKRRRYDPTFLSEGSSRHKAWIDHLMFARKYRVNNVQSKSASWMIGFLNKKITENDLPEFQEVDGAG